MNSMARSFLKIILMLMVFDGVTAELEKVVVYGEKHIFSIDRAENWILDREFAASQRLGSFFYPADTESKTETYFYAQGWDKPGKDSTLQEFLESNLAQLKQSFPDIKYEREKLETAGSVRNAWMYTYINMGDRFKEEVIYLESDAAVVTLVFSTKSKDDYEKYVKDFDKMASSFEYLSSDPVEIKHAVQGVTVSSVSTCADVARFDEAMSEIFVVCPELPDLSDGQIAEVVNNVLTSRKFVPDEYIIYFVISDKHLSKELFTEDSQVGFYYTHSNEVVIWPLRPSLERRVKLGL